MLMRDEYFGHRDPITGEEVGDREEWLDWDFALSSAFYTVEAFTDSNGIPQWVKDDENVEIAAIRKIDQFQQSVQSITGAKNYKPRPGEYFVPDIKPMSKKKPGDTYLDWVANQRKKREEEDD